MNKQELIERIESLKNLFGNKAKYIEADAVIELIERLDEYENGHADEAPRYVKNILARLRELPLHDREVWLKTIMCEFEQDFSRAKWRDGYEQGKLEGLIERDKPVVPQFVADLIKYAKEKDWDLEDTFQDIAGNDDSSDIYQWYYTNSDNMDKFARAWLDGYTVEKEKLYYVKTKKIADGCNYLNYRTSKNEWSFAGISEPIDYRTRHTRKKLEEAGFGWVFDCPGVEIEEVE